MFNVSQEEVRRYFATVWQNRQSGQLDKAQQRVLAIILEHPEYHPVLENIERYLHHQWLPEGGESNPFLHMSLHLSLQEQCAIDQPEGIADIARQMLQKYDSQHQAEHKMLEALTEMIWQAQHYHTGFDVNIYMTLLRQKLDLSPEDEVRLNPHEL